MADPASWLSIERGWRVEAADGNHVGSVADVLADEQKDIFSGLWVSTGIFGGRYVPAERVAEIVEGSVRLDLTADAVERLPDARP